MKIFTGKVLSVKMAKTAKVAVSRFMVDPIYRKRFKRIKEYLVQDEIGVKVGNIVKFVACRPVSRLKKWKIIEVVGLNRERSDTRKKASSEKL